MTCHALQLRNGHLPSWLCRSWLMEIFQMFSTSFLKSGRLVGWLEAIGKFFQNYLPPVLSNMFFQVNNRLLGESWGKQKVAHIVANPSIIIRLRITPEFRPTWLAYALWSILRWWVTLSWTEWSWRLGQGHSVSPVLLILSKTRLARVT